MTFITPVEAALRWEQSVYNRERDVGEHPPSSRTFLFSTHYNIQWLYSDPPQFLSHYYREYVRHSLRHGPGVWRVGVSPKTDIE